MILHNRIIIFVMCLAGLLAGQHVQAATEVDLSKLRPGALLPELAVTQDLAPEQKKYLGVSRGGLRGLFAASGFKVAEINADVLLLEIFNCYCTSCQAQAPIMNKVYKRIVERDVFQKRVKFLGIGAGNNHKEIATFTRQKSVGFPLLADSDFLLYESLGAPGGTPLTIIAKRKGQTFMVYSAHVGLVNDPDFFMNEIKAALETDPETFVPGEQHEISSADLKNRVFVLDLSEEQIERKVRASMQKACNGDVAFQQLTRVTYPYSGEIYVGTAEIAGEKTTMYAKVVSRKPVCDVCHGIHFILTFDAKGIVRQFEPLHLTKYGNIKWDSSNVDFMRRKLLGLDLTQPFNYNSTIDAVTMATMTSAIIYNSVQRLQHVVDEISGKQK